MGIKKLELGMQWGAFVVETIAVEKRENEVSPGVTMEQWVEVAELRCECGAVVRKDTSTWSGYKNWGYDCGCGAGVKYMQRVTVCLTMPVDIREKLVLMVKKEGGSFGKLVEELLRESLNARGE